MVGDNSKGLLQMTAILWKWHLMGKFKDKFLTGRQSQHWALMQLAAAPLISDLLTWGFPAQMLTWFEKFQSFFRGGTQKINSLIMQQSFCIQTQKESNSVCGIDFQLLGCLSVKSNFNVYIDPLWSYMYVHKWSGVLTLMQRAFSFFKI